MSSNFKYIIDILIENSSTIISDVWGFNITFLGISLTIFTVIYSFIVNKLDELNLNAEEIKKGNNSPIVEIKQNLLENNILSLRRMNRHFIVIILITFVLSIVSFLSKYLYLFSDYYEQRVVVFLLISTFFSSLYIFYMLMKLIFRYSKLMKNL
ncbi:hypothetical protein HNQ88_004034 [Aureibacter tunicatorum]|uniref:DUF2721 domain-containing protein n=1 Tax=Aureibacter tunicatorum TaxID=866807 RepID=A0AAE4BUN5_9BACT|nr:hypothetical protein [Aureibacter tunicatorum]BDD03738.1 hypothetical protein AUTU_12210 [Aureibacter tunicatorum]